MTTTIDTPTTTADNGETLRPGDRIRLVVFRVEDKDGEERNITLRYPWRRQDPEHVCVAGACENCLTRVAQRAPMSRVLGVLRDGQSRAR